MAYIYDIADTWNASGTVFTGIKLNVTDTASAAGSLLMDLQVGGSSRVSVRKDGRISGDGANPYVSLSQAGGTELGWSTTRVFVGNSTISLISTGTVVAGVNSSSQFSLQNSYLGFGTSINSPDTILARDAANTLAQRNGVNAQAFNLYNTYTDASNYERGFMRWSANQLNIGTEAAGTGVAARSLSISSGSITSLNAVGSIRFNMSGVAGPFFLQSNQVRIANFGLTFCADTDYTTPEFSILRDAANTLGQRNGTNAQTSRLYGTYTDAANYRRLTKTMSTAGVAEIKPEGAGTGASGNVLHISGLPTSNPGPGILWNNAGTPAIGT